MAAIPTSIELTVVMDKAIERAIRQMEERTMAQGSYAGEMKLDGQPIDVTHLPGTPAYIAALPPEPEALLSTLTPECLDAIRDMVREEMDAAIDVASTVEYPYAWTTNANGVAVTVGFATREELLAYLVARGVVTEREREQMLGLLAVEPVPPDPRDASGRFEPVELDARPILMPQGLWHPESALSEPKPPPVCTCPIADLMLRGCTCGSLAT